jgi:hypothetical protein
MSWPLFIIDDLKEKERRWEPGATWFIEAYGPGGEHHDYFIAHLASDEYKRDWADKRPPICICLPQNAWWVIDQKASNGGASGWTIAGEAPSLTASPSINVEGIYHGWLRDGVLTDDVEGRRFP